MPECEHLDSAWRVGEPVVEVVADAGEEDATDAGQSLAACKGSQLRLSREQGEGALELFPKSVRCGGAVLTPPGSGIANLSRRTKRNDDLTGGLRPAKVSDEGSAFDDAPLVRFADGGEQLGLLFGRELEGLVVRGEDRDRGTLRQRLAFDDDLARNHPTGGDAHDESVLLVRESVDSRGGGARCTGPRGRRPTPGSGRLTGTSLSRAGWTASPSSKRSS